MYLTSFDLIWFNVRLSIWGYRRTRTPQTPIPKVRMEERRKHHHFLTWNIWSHALKVSYVFPFIFLVASAFLKDHQFVSVMISPTFRHSSIDISSSCKIRLSNMIWKIRLTILLMKISYKSLIIFSQLNFLENIIKAS